MRIFKLIKEIQKIEAQESYIEKSTEEYNLPDVIVKAFDSGIMSKGDFMKAVKNIAHLVPKKVQVRGKDGKVYQAIRWVDPETGKPEKLIDRKFKVEIADGEIEQKVLDISSNTGLSKADKIRMMINEGIFDSSLLNLFTGGSMSDINYYSKNEAGFNIKEMTVKSNKLKDAIRKEQQDNDTPQEREENKLLRTIPIEELWENYEENLEMVITNQHKFAIAYGTGGVGKTFTFRKLAKALELREYDDEIQPNKDQYDYVVISGKITPTQVYADMYRHRDKLIVFDDCDSFLSTGEVQGFLKAGLDTGEETKISNKTPRKEYMIQGDPESGAIPSTFRFSGRVIAITNLTAKQIDQAVKSRSLCSNLTMTVDETIEKLGIIKDKIELLTADKKEVIEVSQEARDLAFELIKRHKDMLGGDINTRTYSNSVLMIHRGIELGHPKDRIERKILGFYESVTGSFDEMIRNTKG